MPRPARNDSIQSIIERSVRDVVAGFSAAIDRAVARRVAEELRQRKPGRPAARPGRKAPARPSRSRRRQDITRWVADRRARRVPIFVIEMTGGLDTKKRIVAKYGAGAAFEKGKPLPKPK